MAIPALARPCNCAWGRPKGTAVVAHSQNSASVATRLGNDRVQRLQRLPRISFSYDRSQMDAAELADLLSQVACFAPGQSFHLGPLPASWDGDSSPAHSSNSSSTSSTSSTSSSTIGGGDGTKGGASSSGMGASSGGASGTSLAIDPARLCGALRRSLVCVAAFTEERHLPTWQHLSARGLAAEPQHGSEQQQQPRRGQQAAGLSSWAVGGLRAPRRGRRVLVGFARAVGDASLVATMHDVAVMPELQGLGLGRQLLERLTRQLDMLGIIDIGLLAPDSCRAFFSACSFGRDTENSTVMALSPGGASSRAGLPLEGMAVHIYQRQQQQ